jgi:VIT1/CCC1 family predicted Fe2+/Mn2+ transporter
MPTTPHTEQHFGGSAVLRDVVIGMADGLTVPFALAAGLSAAVSSTRLVVTAGLAEIAAGAIAMGLGGYLAARSDMEHYAAEERREFEEISELRDEEVKEVRGVFSAYGLKGPALDSVVEVITADRTRWVDFMMRFELGLERPDPKRAPISAATIAVSYLAGGIVPLAPYMLFATVAEALPISIGGTAVALLLFGGVKGRLSGAPVIRSAVQTLVVGGLAAGAAFWLAGLFGK